MDKLKMETRPMDSILGKVAQICPAAVIGDKIDFERLKLELSPELIEDAESYNFTWVGKKDAIMGASTPIRKTLRPCKEESKNWDTTKNLYIEGDNLDVLKLLQESYLGKVKMIYIDPPYNTGNDFVYCDDFADSCEEYMEKKGQCDVETNERLFKNDESNGRFHSNWCTMIYPRLKIARDLLADDGVIFISIDDNEIVNLRKICDEVFNEKLFVGEVVWLKGNAQNDAESIQKNHEYILCYMKKSAKLFNRKQVEKQIYKDSNGYFYEGAGITTGGLGGTLNSRPNLGYSIYYNPITDDKIAVADYDIDKAKFGNDIDEIYTDNVELLNKGYSIIRAPQKGEKLGCWTWSLDKFNSEKQNILIKQTSKGFSVCKKEYIQNITNDSEKATITTVTPIKSFIDNVSSAQGTIEVTELFGKKIFTYPKPMNLIKYIINCVSDSKDSIIMDFFSGSATTAHAVMQLNAEDGGNRRFIMVQLPELTDEKSEAFKAGYKNICEIGKERIRRAGDKIVAETGKSDLDIGFKVLKLDETNMKDIYYTPMDTTQAGLLNCVDNIKSDRSELDLLYGVMIDLGLQLDLDVSEIKSGNTIYYNVDDGSLVACFAQNIPDSIIKEIAELKPLKVVFRDSSFADAPSKINVTEIFKTISPNTKITVL